MDDGENRGLLDTSVVIDLPKVPVERLPDELAISTVTLAELAVEQLQPGVHHTTAHAPPFVMTISGTALSATATRITR